MCEVGRELLCVLFLHARSNDFFLVHFIYLFCKMALIVYIPQSPCPALTFFLCMHYMSLSYYMLARVSWVLCRHSIR